MKKQTTQEFIEKAKRKHGDKYDYCKVDYKNNKTNVTIICPKHGEFLQTPNTHINVGCGCPNCAGKLTTKEFVEKAKKVHGNRYGYSEVDYKNAVTVVKITCSEHGSFLQTPDSHLSGHGCAGCAGNVKSTAEEFIEKAKKIHGDKYSYSEVDYKGAKIDVSITCIVHGIFSQAPSDHLSGRGCPDCAGNKKSTTEEFIAQATSKHGDKYDYSRVDYQNRYTVVLIRCPEHGEFSQTPSNHLSGQGCPTCGGKEKLTRGVFIERAKKIHSNLYDYSKVDYKSMNEKVDIICKIHGAFSQRPINHLFLGQGCPKCTSKVSKVSQTWLDFMGVPDDCQHREVSIFLLIDDKEAWVSVDGLIGDTVYEFHGDYWHGNPKKFSPNDVHPRIKKTYGELYAKTQERTDTLKAAGYRVVEMWESEWIEVSKILS